jgi:iron(III) transport system ATP-binding protein
MATFSPPGEGRLATSSAAPARVVVRNLSKTYRTRRGDVPALRNVSVELGDGEILVLLGPSGCGKTTLLRCVAGLEQPDEGEIIVHGKTVFSSSRGISLPPEQRLLSMVFQSYALWPHMTVFENVAYPLRNQKVREPEVRERGEMVLRLVGLQDYSATYPGQLSGGQQQRVALARAVVPNDGLVLFDEPLSNLDAKLRERMRIELLSLHREIHFSALYVTHDQTEATALGDRIAVMDTGVVAQIGSPAEIYHEPNSRYVAEFVGSANELSGRVVEREGDFWRVDSPIGELLGRSGGDALSVGDEVAVLFRPEHCRLADAATATNATTARVVQSMFLGSYVEYVVQAGTCTLVLRSLEGQPLPPDSDVRVSIDPERVRLFRAG